MNKSEISKDLKFHYLAFNEMIAKMEESLFIQTKNDKWSPGQQLDHLCKSVQPLVLAFRLPKWLVRILIGKPNRNSRSYDELVARYQEKLQKGAIATGRFVPPVITFDKKEKLMRQLKLYIKKLTLLVENQGEEELDNIILPHPLLGKITAREMLYFTIYHVQHHKKLITRDYL